MSVAPFFQNSRDEDFPCSTCDFACSHDLVFIDYDAFCDDSHGPGYLNGVRDDGFPGLIPVHASATDDASDQQRSSCKYERTTFDESRHYMKMPAMARLAMSSPRETPRR